jgi:branched-chain amino acid transport system permease protein
MGFFLQQTLNGLVLGCVYALFALGFSMVLSILRIFNVAHEGVITWGALIAYAAIAVLGLPWMVGLVIAAIGAGLVNAGVYTIAIRHLQKRPDREMAGFISSLGMLIAVVEIADLAINREVRRLPFTAFPFMSWRFGGISISSMQIAFVVSTAIVFLVLWWTLQRTQFGREIRTVAFSRDIAATLGINVERTMIWVFFISGACAGIGATLVGTAFNVIDSGLGSRYLLTAIAVTVIGGFGSLPGAAVAGLLVGLVSSLTTAYWTTSFRDVVIFSTMLLVLWITPRGLFGSTLESGRA